MLSVAPGGVPAAPVLRTRWLGRVAYRDALALQQGLWEHSADDYLLLLEHPPVYTLGLRADPAHVLVDPASVGADLVRADRGGDVTYHGPGQLVGYPIVTVARPPALPDTPAYVRGLEQMVIDALAEVGLPDASRLDGLPGVWVGVGAGEPRKIAAVGTRLSRGRSRHGFAINVDPDLAMFSNIVPCGITAYGVTSLAAEGVVVTMREMVDAVVAHAVGHRWDGHIGTDRTSGDCERADVAWRVATTDLASFTRDGADGGVAAPSRPVRLLGRLAAAGVGSEGGKPIAERKPAWLRVRADLGPEYRRLKRTMRSLDLVTVCEEAGCPNIFECWAAGTATFMINGDRCTRACGFCQVDTRHPGDLVTGEAARVAEAVERMGLAYAVVTAVARDDLADGGAAAFAATVGAIRSRCPGTAVEVLIPDLRGDPASLATVFEARPEVLNHNLETVARLQRAVRPSAGYSRSLAVLARAKRSGLTTKSGMIVGMGETDDEVVAALADLGGVGVDIVTVGQYLRPTAAHLPVARWVEAATFERFREEGRRLGIAHVEASPLTRSSHHAREAAEAVRSTRSPAGASSGR